MKKMLILTLISAVFLSGCSIIKNGNDLSAFISRMNEKNEAYNISENGFLFDDKKNEFIKFFLIEESEILLSFKADNKGRLIELHITTPCLLNENELLSAFVLDALFCFINDDKTTEALLSETDFANNILKTKNETIKTKNGNTELLLDVTEIGTVITVYKDL